MKLDLRTYSAARHLLTLAVRAPFEAEGAMLLAAASAVVGATNFEQSWDAVSDANESGIALVIAAGAELQSRTGRAKELVTLGQAVPVSNRPHVLFVAERLLAHVDPVWTWNWIEELLGNEHAVEAALGLNVAAHMALDKGREWSPGLFLRGPYARQLVADQTARLAVAGDISDRNDPRFVALRDREIMQTLFASEARSLLVGAAAVDPDWALDRATSLLDFFGPEDLLQAFRLVASAAVRAGIGNQVVEKTREDGFVSERATWAAAAASAGAIEGKPLLELADELIPRIEDELDSGRELLAGLPLLEALAQGGEADLFFELAQLWAAPPPLLVNILFFAGTTKRAFALQGHAGWDYLMERPETEWANLYHYAFGWWIAAGTDPKQRSAAVRSAIDVVLASPWRPLPGSLADLVGWPSMRGNAGDLILS